MDFLTKIPEATRAYFYRVSVAVMAVLILLDIIDSDKAPVILDVVFVVLGIGSAGLATANTSRN